MCPTLRGGFLGSNDELCESEFQVGEDYLDLSRGVGTTAGSKNMIPQSAVGSGQDLRTRAMIDEA